jgi:hypothetical protein
MLLLQSEFVTVALDALQQQYIAALNTLLVSSSPSTGGMSHLAGWVVGQGHHGAILLLPESGIGAIEWLASGVFGKLCT